MRLHVARLTVAVAASLFAASIVPVVAAPRVLSLEDRIRAQEAIERAYYAHQTEARLPFEEAVPRALLEEKVRTYLKQSAALNRFWNTPITAPMLRAELDRMARNTRMPDRLREIYGALGNDPVLILECLARPALASRMARNFFAGDAALAGDGRHDWDAWWRDTSRTLDPSTVGTVAGEEATLPAPAAAQPCANDVWNNGSLDDYPSPRDNHTAVWTGSRMIIWGSATTFPSTGALYDPATDTWTLTSTVNAPAERTGHTAFWTGSRMLIWGGYGGNQLNTGGQYDPIADVWTPITTSGAPSARWFHSAVWTGTNMVVWGGEPFTNTGGRYDPVSDSWLPTSTVNAPSPRSNASSVWTGVEMIVWGGTNNAGNTGGRYNPVADTWTPTATLGAPSARSDSAAVWTGSRMVVWGGTTQTGGRYDPSTDTWLPTSTAGAPAARNAPTAVWTGSRMLVWGGFGIGSYLNTGGSYDPVVDSWTGTSTVGAPVGRQGHTAVWTGSRMLVWGGMTLSGKTNFGGRYDPATDSWAAIANGGVPAGRNDTAVVWTGTVMVVWGGIVSGNVRQNTGGRYDPALDTWTPTSTVNAGVDRGQRSVVWTGTEMIIWGGTPGGQTAATNTGQRYNPTSDTWTATATLGAPSSRGAHVAVWTGSRMVVWGGSFSPFNGGPISQYNDGGRYNPSDNTWVPTATAGAPAARVNALAVWTGTQMVVWGGNTIFVGPQTTGGRYDPGADSWFPTSTVNAPMGRFNAISAWAGGKMIVWGGSGDGSLIDPGARYDPVLDSWSPITGGPSLRDLSSAVSTVREMILWGGSPDPSQVGWRYDAIADAWSPTSLTNAPHQYASMSTVWTGDSMLVWGGNNNAPDVFLNLGGRYCACTNSTYYTDADGDGFGDPNTAAGFCSTPPGGTLIGGDCNDGDATAWQAPSEVHDLMSADQASLSWQAPVTPGGTVLLYDVIRSSNRSDYVTAADCVATKTPDATESDASVPPVGGIFYYLVRSENGCVPGEGSLGTDSNGVPRTARHCP